MILYVPTLPLCVKCIVLKPGVLRDLLALFDPLSFDPNESGCILNIRVVCIWECAANPISVPVKPLCADSSGEPF